LAAYNIMLSKYTGQEDIVVGTAAAGRTHADVEQTVGMFINTLALRHYPTKEKPFNQFLEEVKEHVLQANEHQNYPFEQLVEQLVVRRDTARNPLFDTMFLLQNMDIPNVKMGEVIGIPFGIAHQVAKFDMTWEAVEEQNGEIECNVEYSTSLYKKETLERMSGHFVQILRKVVEQEQIRLCDIEMVTAGEKEQLVYGFNQTKASYPSHQTIHQIFEEQAQISPDHIALVHEQDSMSYRSLNKKANQLGRYLQECGVTANKVVGIMADRSIDMVIGILAILKAGGTYLPIDPKVPADRINYMLKDSGTKILLTQPHLKTEGLHCETVVNLSMATDGFEDTNILSTTGSQNLAYIMYTSGSTGNPKGVMIPHKGLLNYLWWANKSYFKDEAYHCALYSSIAFDLTVTSLYLPLITGKTLFIYEGTDAAVVLTEVLTDDRVGMLKITPSHMKLLEELKLESKNLKVLITGGEDLKRDLADRVHQQFNGEVTIYNEYGPTEATVGCMIYEYEPAEQKGMSVSIGRPADNMGVYMLDEKLNPVVMGSIGELCISGEGLAEGYLNQPELTAEKFVANPFKPGEKMYRSGDLARWLPDGTLEYMGRMDHQVKIRGYRIECGEIEAQLLKHESVNETLVMARESEDGSKYLVAYIVSETQVDVTELRRNLEKHVPSYMVPAYFIQVERMPLTANGKVDRKALPLPEEGWMRGNEYVAPQGEMEEQLAEIWKEVLGIEQVGRTDNFFELGGDSIKAVQVSARLQRHGLKMEIRDLFQNPSVEQVSPYLKSQTQLSHQGAVEGEVELSPIQQWFFEGQKKARHHFNHSVMLYRKEGYREDIVQQVMQRMMEHHDALRMVYEQTETTVHQYNKGIQELLVEVPVLEVRGQSLEEVERQATRIQESIDLEKGPMMRLGLFRADDGDHLLIVIHHLVVDGVSWRILLEDFTVGYAQALKGEEVKFQAKTASYQEWSSRMKEYTRSEAFAAEKSYWQQRINQANGVGAEVTAEEVGQIGDGKYIEVQLDEDMTEKALRQVNQAYNTEINDILMTALALSIHEWDGRKEICIDMEGHGREELVEGLDITRTVGWFTSIYPVILQVKEQELGRQIKTIKEALRSIPNKGIGYGMYRYWSEEGQDPKVSGISFNYLGQFDQDFQTEIFKGSSLSVGGVASPMLQRSSALEINGIVKEGRMQFAFGYNGKQYREQEMENLAGCYMQKLVAIIKHCVEKDRTELTPSDVMAHDMSIEEIEDVYALTASKGLTIEKMYPLAPLQEGMLFHHVMNKGDLQYFVQTSFEVRGNLDIGLLEQSYQELINRHDVLRSIFIFENIRRSLQVVIEQWKFIIDVQKIANKSDAEQEEVMSRYMEEDKNKGFDLTTTIPMRVAVFEMSEQQFKVIWSFHHIVIDGWCMSTLFTELLQIYEFLSKGTSLQLETAQPYSRFIQWLEKQDKAKASDYWKNYLKTIDEVTTLPGYKKTADGYKQEELWFTLGEEQTRKLQQLANKYQVTLNTMMQTIWGVVLQKYNRTNDVVFGAVVSGRPAVIPGIEKMIGLFINTIPVRISSSSAQPFIKVLQAVQDAAIVSDSYSSYLLYEIQNQSTLKQDLINHIMVFENYPMDDRLKDMSQTAGMGLELSNFNTFEQTNYDFNVILIPGKELAIKFSYNLNAFEVGSVERMKGHVQHVMQQIIANPNATMDEIEIVTSEEKEQLVYGFNQTKASYPLTLTIHQLFEEQAQKTPENMAVVDKERRLTYRQLNERANQLARTIKSRGVKQESIVALLLDRSVETIISILAVLKAGGTYLPIDPDYPAERVEYIFEDSKVS
ncbi:non-ribosomal peptide synthetase, partial [Paenibacillus helianthi]|uniref:non-ribosomal peptide synthetase n=1 Tax=Paenibacillus helianthi TaxID=1349432 RepID=UPI000B0B35EF